MKDKELQDEIRRIVTEQLTMRGNFIEAMVKEWVSEYGIGGIMLVENRKSDNTIEWHIEKREQPVEPTPQPVATLCEAAQRLSDYLDSHNTDNSHALMLARNAVKDALTAERKRAVLVDEVEVTRNKVIEDYRIVLKLQKHAGNCACALCTRLLEFDAALDAFDKGAV